MCLRETTSTLNFAVRFEIKNGKLNYTKKK